MILHRLGPTTIGPFLAGPQSRLLLYIEEGNYGYYNALCFPEDEKDTKDEKVIGPFSAGPYSRIWYYTRG